jgi:hypothetical protein
MALARRQQSGLVARMIGAEAAPAGPVLAAPLRAAAAWPGLPLDVATSAATARLQSALLVASFGRAAARAAAERLRISVRSAPSVGGTGVPSGKELLDPGEPVSTPAGMRDVSLAFGGNRGGGFGVGGGVAVCAAAARTKNAADSKAGRKSASRFTKSSWHAMRQCAPGDRAAP